ncbi:MAG: hopanoid biosynthesis-associated RND transporter HpnN, partial [Betaproteobacteria bacterium]
MAHVDQRPKPESARAAAFHTGSTRARLRGPWHTLISGQNPNPRELRRFILVQPVLDYGAVQPGKAASDTIRAVAQQLHLDADPRIRVRLTGSVPLADEEFATLADGAVLNGVLMLAAMLALLWAALRTWRLILAVMLSLTAGLIVTAAFGLWLFGAFNLISVAFAVLFVGLGVDFSIQFCVAYRAERHL